MANQDNITIALKSEASRKRRRAQRLLAAAKFAVITVISAAITALALAGYLHGRSPAVQADLWDRVLQLWAGALAAQPATPAKQHLDPEGRPYPPPSWGEPDYPLVDFSFALDCRELEGMPGFHRGDAKIFPPFSSWDTAVVDYEKAYHEGEAAGDWSSIEKWWLGTEASKTTHVESYWDHVLVAYNHGQVDGNSTDALRDTHVYEVTPNVIRVGSPSIPAGAYGYPVDGYFDRKTGHGEILQYEMNEPRAIGSIVQKMYLFQCEAAKPNKF
jgi:hypothetical protein